MQTGQHIEACQRFLDDALALESRGSHMGAAEMIWGATVQALEAIGHIRAGNATGNLSRNARRRLAGSAVFEGMQHYDQVRRRLHGHFYDGHLTSQERDERMRLGREFVGGLLAVALSVESDEI